MKVYSLVLLATCAVFSLGLAHAKESLLPVCEKRACLKVFHNEFLEKAVVVIWSGKANIIKKHSFELGALRERSAWYMNAGENTSTVGEVDADGVFVLPKAPCKNGFCSTTLSSSYVTPTEVVTITVIQTYRKGTFFDSDVAESRKPLSGKLSKTI